MIRVYLCGDNSLALDIEDDQGHEYSINFSLDETLLIKKLLDDPTDDILELEGEVQ